MIDWSSERTSSSSSGHAAGTKRSLIASAESAIVGKAFGEASGEIVGVGVDLISCVGNILTGRRVARREVASGFRAKRFILPHLHLDSTTTQLSLAVWWDLSIQSK